MGLIFQAVFFFPILKHGQGHVLLQKPWLLSGFKDPWRHTPIRNVWEYPPSLAGTQGHSLQAYRKSSMKPPFSYTHPLFSEEES